MSTPTHVFRVRCCFCARELLALRTTHTLDRGDAAEPHRVEVPDEVLPFCECMIALVVDAKRKAAAVAEFQRRLRAAGINPVLPAEPVANPATPAPRGN